MMEREMPNEAGVHRIRLKGPWEVIPPDASREKFARHAMPQAWRSLFGDIAGTALFRRNFHTPSGLEEHDRVLIHVPSGVGELNLFSINKIEIEPRSVDPLLFDVTEHLNEFNRLEFSLSFDPAGQPDMPGGLWETVFLEIHSS